MSRSTWSQSIRFAAAVGLAAIIGCSSPGGGGGGGGDGGQNDGTGDNGGGEQTAEAAAESLRGAMDSLLSEPGETGEWLDDLVESIGSVYQTESTEDAPATTRNVIVERIQSSEDLEQVSAASDNAAGKFITITAASASGRRLQGISTSGRVRLIYVNGINTTIPEAINSTYALRDALDEAFVSVDEMGLFYNRSATEVEIEGATFCDVLRLVPFAERLADVCRVGGALVDLGEATVQVIQAWLTFLPVPDQVADLVEVAQSHMDGGGRVIFVGHSQGNLFISQAIEELGGYEDQYSVVSVATPISISGSALVQMEDDVVVEYVPTSPRPNINHPLLTNIFCSLNPVTNVGCGLAYHSFDGSYLAPGSEARTRIQEAVELAVQALNPEITPGEDDGVDHEPGPSPTGETLTLDLGGGVTMELLRIPAGTFMMGSDSNEAASDEQPVHSVTISRDYYIGRYEVTQAHWQAVMDDPPPFIGGCNNCPATQVTWNDALSFCGTLSNMTGNSIRLPSEAEWEYACRAGTTTDYSFGDDAADLDDYGWYQPGGSPTEVGGRLPNPWGLYDMHGNVWEWCEDGWHENYAGAPSDGSAWTLGGDSSNRVHRGGSAANPHGLRSADRDRDVPDYRVNGNGFRVAAGT